MRWRRNVWRKLTWKWHQDVKHDVKTSKSSNWRHARESSYRPHVRHFLGPVGFTEILIGYARKFGRTRLTYFASSFLGEYSNGHLSALMSHYWSYQSRPWRTAPPFAEPFPVCLCSDVCADPIHKRGKPWRPKTLKGNITIVCAHTAKAAWFFPAIIDVTSNVTQKFRQRIRRLFVSGVSML